MSSFAGSHEASRDGPQTIASDTTAARYQELELHQAKGLSHIDPAGSSAQISTAVTDANAYGAGLPMILAGDFNNHPSDSAMSVVYKANGTGNYQEINQCASPNQRTGGPPNCNLYTHAAGHVVNSPETEKIDYIFGKQAYFASGRSDSVQVSKYSDHGILMGAITECSTTTQTC